MAEPVTVPEDRPAIPPASADWLSQSSHRRFNILTGEWVLVSPQRALRPWHGQIDRAASPKRPIHDPTCFLCPGNTRTSGERNPDYQSTFAFDNDFPALSKDESHSRLDDRGVLVASKESGICRVICYSSRHDRSLPDLDEAAVTALVNAWCAEYHSLSAMPWIEYVEIFENRGDMMGASSPHPHGQIWATRSVPVIAAREQRQCELYRLMHGACPLCVYMDRERELGDRIVAENRWFAALVPFWAVWPFEVLISPRAHVFTLPDLTAEERRGLAAILLNVTRRYDSLFDTEFPYSMGFHQQAAGQAQSPHLHAHFYPPLLRSATVRKFMVGYELLAEAQRDITPESAAAMLREQNP